MTREQVTYFATADVDDLRSGRVPSVDLDGRPELLRVPRVRRPRRVQGRRGLRRSRRRPGHAHVRRRSGDGAAPRRVRRYDSSGIVARSHGRRCLYTLTPDRDFVVDRLPDCPQVVVGLGAAHGFKFAAWFGRQLAALVTGGDLGPELAPFAITRQGAATPRNARRLARLIRVVPAERRTGASDETNVSYRRPQFSGRRRCG